jgi:hypothetical protein
MTGMYILDSDNQPVPADDTLEWAKWIEMEERRIGKTQIDDSGDVWVSTVFLGMDHNFSMQGPPVLWETMVFGSEHEELKDLCERYTSYADAKAGHERIVELARSLLDGQAS